MRISDQERREVAAKLRNGGIARDSKEAYTLLLSCVGIRPQLPVTNTYEDAMVRLADLIDRPTCCNVYDEIYDEYEGGRCENGFKCSKCGELVEDCEGYRITGTFNYCPKCGREVVS